MCSRHLKRSDNSYISNTTAVISADYHPQANGRLVGSVLNGRTVHGTTGAAEARDSTEFITPPNDKKIIDKPAATGTHKNKLDSWRKQKAQ